VVNLANDFVLADFIGVGERVEYGAAGDAIVGEHRDCGGIGIVAEARIVARAGRRVT